MRLLSTPRRSWLFVVAAFLWAVDSLFFYQWKWEPMADESWCLHLASRVLHGELPYRDMHFAVPLFSMYWAAGAVAVLGSQTVVIRLMNCLCCAITLCLCAYQARRGGADDRTILLLALAFPLFADPRPDLLYSVFATLFFVAAGIAEQPALAGLLAGLAFASKQTAGAYAMAALLAFWAFEKKAFWSRATAALAVFTGVAALCVVPVIWSGTWRPFVSDLFHRGAYMRTGAVNYFRDAYLNPVPWMARDGILRGLGRWIPFWRFLLPLALVPLGWRAFRTQDRLRVRAWIFGAASLLLFFPRADEWHLRLAAPSLLITVALIPVRPPRAWVAAVLAAVLAWPLCMFYVIPAWHWQRGKLVAAGLPHFRGVLARPEVARKWGRELPLVHAAAQQYGPMFIQTQQASIIYLAGDIPSHTRFDYPLVNVFGDTGEEETIAAIRSGGFRSVCLNEDLPPPVAPGRLIAYVKTSMIPGPDFGLCRLYLPRGD